jgi:hypothetical protein
MPKKILIIEKCEKCPFMEWSATCPCCDHNQSSFKEIPDFETIPDWCPLEDYEEIENNVYLLTQKLLKLEKENKELNYWIEKVKKDNDWLTGYEKMWKAFKKEFDYCDLTYYDGDCPENSLSEPLFGNMEYFEGKYLGGKK